jgi:hypothetical protein
MAQDTYTWDFFLAHAGADKALAEALFDLLEEQARVFLDSRRIKLGDDWDLKLARAQKESRVTVVLVSPRTEAAYYERVEIATAIRMSRAPDNPHRVVPLYFNDDPSVQPDDPYGLILKHSLTVKSVGEFPQVAQELLSLLAQLRAEEDAQRKDAIVETKTKALAKLAGSSDGSGGGLRRAAALSEVTEFFGPLRWILVFILVASVLGIFWCLLIQPLVAGVNEASGLAPAGLGLVAAASFGGLMVIINKSVSMAREIKQNGLA